MVMYDRETHSWWQQAVGTAIVGELNGTQLRALPTMDGKLGRVQGAQSAGPGHGAGPSYNRSYGRNPYEGYDSLSKPFLYNVGDELPPHGIPPLARVVRVGDRAWPVSRLRDHP